MCQLTHLFFLWGKSFSIHSFFFCPHPDLASLIHWLLCPSGFPPRFFSCPVHSPLCPLQSQLTLSRRLATPQLTALENLELLSSAKTGAVNFWGVISELLVHPVQCLSSALTLITGNVLLLNLSPPLCVRSLSLHSCFCSESQQL